jgi:hypothetical protein
MTRPYVVAFENSTDASFDVIVNYANQSEALVFARDYFGGMRTDYRNKNRVEYLYSDFDGNHTYRVTLEATC